MSIQRSLNVLVTQALITRNKAILNISSLTMKTIRLQRVLLTLTIVLLLVGSTSVYAQSKWRAGIGTGFSLLNLEGDWGFHTEAFGPILATDVDLSPDDIMDVMEGAIGFGGYVTNGKVMVQYSFLHLKLGDEPSGTLPNGLDFEFDLELEMTQAELTVGYTAYTDPNGKVSLQPYVGVRYKKHDWSADLTVFAGTPEEISRGIDENWTDALVGAALNVSVAPQVRWNTRFDVGFGGSNSTLAGATALTWTPLRWLTLSPNAFFKAIDFENGDQGDPDWYLYDMSEFGGGLSFMIHFL